MSLLLDTHVLLWWLVDDPTLSGEIKDRLDDEAEVFVSAASVWEIAIKHAKGRLTGPPDLPERVQDCGFRELPIAARHAVAAGRLPMIHADPFDRMLIAQARSDDLTLATRDPVIRSYDVRVLDA